MSDKENRRYKIERLRARRKKGSFYGERNNTSIPVFPTGQGHNVVPVSDLLALFDSHQKREKDKKV